MTGQEATLRRWATAQPSKEIKAFAVSAWAVQEIDDLRKTLAAAIERESTLSLRCKWYADSRQSLLNRASMGERDE